MSKRWMLAGAVVLAMTMVAVGGRVHAGDAPKEMKGAGDPTKVCPNVYKSLMDNERVRVCDVHFKVGEKAAMHSHPAHVVYVMNDCKLSILTPDGKTNVVELKAGQTLMMPAGDHEVTNVGKTEAHNLVVELKK